MACESCRTLVRAATTRAVAPRAPQILATAPTRRYISSFGNGGPSAERPQRQLQPQHTGQTRHFSRTSPSRFLKGIAASDTAQPYFVVASTERMFAVCGAQASYSISAKMRESEEGVKMLADGEEVGQSTAENSIWHESEHFSPIQIPRVLFLLWLMEWNLAAFGLPPTFSTWSHVTMLHLYVLNARIRQFDREGYRRWQQQLVDHFFFEAEKKMHVDHNITSAALRQRYLKDIFVQWRGLLLAYDEGLVKGDAILASALWRNLFKGNPNVDPRALAAIVGWMRASLKALEATSDYTFSSRAVEILSVPVRNFYNAMEKACGANVASDAAASGEQVEPEDISETARPVTPVAAKVAKP